MGYRGQHGWRRSFAVAMLIWALFDLTIPGLCSTEDQTRGDLTDAVLLGGISAAHQACTLHRHTAKLSVERGGPSEQQQSSGEEDCWCCCSHITPSANFELAGQPELTSYEPACIASAPHKVALFTFHPPRS